MYERFTNRARNVMRLSEQEAQRFNHEYIGTEHILLGLITDSGGLAGRVLKNLRVDLRRLRFNIEKILVAGPAIRPGDHMPLTPRAKAVINASKHEAGDPRCNRVSTGHLLAGLITGEGVAAQVLMDARLTLEDIRKEILATVE